MSTLYIIGNGFDLHHGLPTRYADFHNFIIENYAELENSFEEYFVLTADPSDNYLWSNFECDLATFSFKAFFDNYNNCDPLSESFRRSDAFGVEDEINEAADALVESIRDAFAEWIDSIEIIESANKNSIKLDLSADSSFINFNYTDTLEVLYQIPRDKIFYIHNKAGDFNGELIFGHGQAEETNPKPDELDELGNSNRTMFTDAEDAARAVFYAFQKDTEEVIKENDQYFKNSVGISQIMVLGHSLNEVDWPYFQQIAKFAPSASWAVSYYGEKELKTIRIKAASMLNFEADKISMIEVDDLC